MTCSDCRRPLSASSQHPLTPSPARALTSGEFKLFVICMLMTFSDCRRNMISERIRTADYFIPATPATSWDLKHLLSRMLIADPLNRATIPEILEHSWFRTKLPKGYFHAQKAALRQPRLAGLQTRQQIVDIVVEANQVPPMEIPL